jgi:quercetin dioxygenase-like cupin family protein
MRLTRNSLETAPGPSEWFTGKVFIDTLATASEPSRLAATSVHFTPGACTAWHTHTLGQTIQVTEGIGPCQRRGAGIGVMRPGESVFFEPGEEHWRGPRPPMSHMAMQQLDKEGSPVEWSEHVSDEEYGAAPPSDG